MDLLPALPLYQASFSFSVIPLVPIPFCMVASGILIRLAGARVFVPAMGPSCPLPLQETFQC